MTTPLCLPMTGPISRRASVTGPYDPFVPSNVRITLNGKVQSFQGTPLNPPLGGMNYSAWNTNGTSDGTIAKAENWCAQPLTRLLLRTKGNYGGKPTDSYDTNCAQQCDNVNRQQQYNEVKMFTDQQIWVCAAIDSNCLQSGTQDTATMNLCIAGGGASDVNWPTIAPSDPNYSLYTTSGRNLFNDASQLGQHLELWKMYVRLLSPLPYIYCWEVLPEPCPSNGLFSYDSTWSPKIAAYILAVRAVIRELDPYTPILVGGRQAYKYTNLLEIQQYLKTSVTGIINEFIYTWDDLSDLTRDLGGHRDVVIAAASFRDTNNEAVMCQSSGTRRDDDLNSNGFDVTQASQNPHAGLMSSIFHQRCFGIPSIWWQRHQNTTNLNAYSLDTFTNGTDPSGGFTLKQPEHDLVVGQYQLTMAALETAAQSAATAAGGKLFYCGAFNGTNYPGMFQDAALTTPVTAVGQHVHGISPLIGSGLTFTQAGADALAPTLQLPSYTIDQRPVLQFVGPTAGDFLSGSTTFFTTGDDMTVIVAFYPATGTNLQVMFAVGTSALTEQYPYLACSIGNDKFPHANWHDDASASALLTDSLTTSQNIGSTNVPFVDGATSYPTVISAVKSGTTYSLYRNGLLSKTATATLSTIAPTRMRLGADTQAGHGIVGQIGGIFICKGGVTGAQRLSIERWLGWIIGAPIAA